MIDSIGSSTSLVSSKRAQSLQTSRLQSADVLTAVQQSRQKSSGATAPVRVFAVQEASKSGTASAPKLPRGSLVDVLA